MSPDPVFPFQQTSIFLYEGKGITRRTAAGTDADPDVDDDGAAMMCM